MLGSANAFGQSSSTSPFGSQSVFGEQMGGGGATNNAFAQNPFGTPNPLASSTGGSVFGGGTSTGVFGQSSAPTFGAPSKQAFGSPMPAFGSSSSSSSSSFGGSPPFGQKSTFGGFGSTPSQTSSYGSTFQQTQPASGSNGFGSTPFGASSQSTFGASCAPAFGATSTPALGAATLPASGATITPTFRTTKCQAFGSTTTSSFGSTGPALGVSSSLAFGSTVTAAFGGQSTSAFGSPSTPAFGATSAPTFISAFGASTTSSLSFGSTPSFGQSTSACSSTPFGTMPSHFSAQSAPFGAQTAISAFGSPGCGPSPFGGQQKGSRVVTYTQTTETDGASGTQAYVKLHSISAMPVYKEKSHEELRSEDYQLGDKGAQTAISAFGSPGCGQSPFGGQQKGSRVVTYTQTTEIDGASGTQAYVKLHSISAMPVYKEKSHEELRSEDYQLGDKGAQTAISAFGSPGCGPSPFGGQQKGSRVVTYTQTTETDGASGTQAYVKLHSISAMPMYKEKSHEELRCEDYQLRDKGAQTAMSAFGSPGCGQSPFGGQQKGSRVVTYTQTTEIDGAGSTQAYVKLHSISAMPVNKEKSHEELRSEDYQLGDKGGLKSTGQPAGAVSFPSSTQANPFGPSSPSPFGGSATPALGSSSMVFGSSTAGSSSSSAFSSFPGLGSTQSSGLHQSTLSIGQSPSPCGQPSTGFQPTKPSFGSNLFSMQSTDQQEISFSNWVPSTLPTSNFVGFGQTTPSLSAASEPASPIQTSSTFAFNYTGQTRSASSDGRGRMPSILSQATSGQLASTLSSKVVQPVPVKTPFGTLPPLPQISTVRVGLTHSIQYGVSSMSVAEKPTPVRQYTLSVPKHLSRRRIRLPAWNYKPKNDGPKVPFFMVDDEMQPTLKADTLFVRRENPRSLVTQPIEGWTSRISSDKPFMLKDTHNPANRNAGTDGNDLIREQDNLCSSLSKCSMQQPLETKQVRIQVFDEDAQETNSTYGAISGDKAGKDLSVSEHGTDIEALLPKLQHADYFTEPRVQELAAKERAEPGFCCHVKDFVVGRDGYGSIKFDGETDVRGLDLESIIQFNNREVIVYKDNSRKPPVGQGLNKPAEVTLLNLKCINKKTGKQYTEGPKVGEYKELLIKKAEEQGAEFVSFDAIKGLWKFKVSHFSSYGFEDGH